MRKVKKKLHIARRMVSRRSELLSKCTEHAPDS